MALFVLFANALSVERYAFEVTRREGNRGVTLFAYHPYFVDPTSLVIDVWEVGDTTRPVDVMRAMFQIAERLKDRKFTTVKLARRGETRFVLKGERFQTIGREFEFQNPIFVIRTLPEDLYLPNGEAAYGHWTGGWLGVLNKQMEDFNDFWRKWLIS